MKNLAEIYACFPDRFIFSTQDALNVFSRRLPGLHRPREVGLEFLIMAIPYLLIDEEFADMCYAIAEDILQHDSDVNQILDINQLLDESSIEYSVEELYDAFLEMCGVMYDELHHLDAYRFNGVFPYELDHQIPFDVEVVTGVVLKRISFEKFNYYA